MSEVGRYRFPRDGAPRPAAAGPAAAARDQVAGSGLAPGRVRWRVPLGQPGHRLRRVRAVLPVPARATPCCSRSGCSSPAATYQVLGIDNKALELTVALALLIAAAFLGNVAGYEIGRKIGPPLYERDGRIVKRKHLDKTSAFFEKHGNKALVIGRFVPFVRTYITVVAGVTRMERRRFFLWSGVGAVALGASASCCSATSSARRSRRSARTSTTRSWRSWPSRSIPIAYEWRKHRRNGAAARRSGRPEPTRPPPTSEPTRAASARRAARRRPARPW